MAKSVMEVGCNATGPLRSAGTQGRAISCFVVLARPVFEVDWTKDPRLRLGVLCVSRSSDYLLPLVSLHHGAMEKIRDLRKITAVNEVPPANRTLGYAVCC